MKKLRPYQLDAFHYLIERQGRGALFMEMRLGKSLPAIRYLRFIMARRVLLVAPYSALADWKTELIEENQMVFDLFNVDPKERYAEIRLHQYDHGWFLINKESHLYLDLFSFNWDAVVIDELWMASPRTQVSKYFMKFCDAKYRIYLTGTPAPDSELQYFCPLFMIDPSIFGSRSFWDFRIRNFRIENFRWVPSLVGRKRINEAIARNCFCLKRKDVGMEVPREYKKRILKLPPAIRKQYAFMESHCMDQQGNILKWAGARMDALKRMVSGIGPDGSIIHDLKLKELKYLLDNELKDQKVIVWAWHQAEIDRIHHDFPSASKIDGRTPQESRELKIRGFKEWGSNPLVLQSDVFKFGKNLVGADAVIFFSQPNSAMARQQCECRSEDVSNPDPTLIIDLIIENSIDEDRYIGLKNKESDSLINERLIRGIKARSTGRIQKRHMAGC